MNFPTDEQRIIELLSNGYVIPTDIFDEKAIENILKAKFLHNKKSLKIVKEYDLNYKNVLSAKLDSRFQNNIDTIITYN